MIGRNFPWLWACAIFSFDLSDDAWAQQPAPEVVQACRADVKRLCPFTIRGSEKRRECLREHRSELSKDCIDAIRKSRGSSS